MSELMEEITTIVQAILEGKQETPYFPEAEAWLALILCIRESPVTREELVERAESMRMPAPLVTEIDWALERLAGRGWLRDAYVIDSAKESGWEGEWTYTLAAKVKKKLRGIMGDMSDPQEAHRRLIGWISTHPPDSPSEEVVLAYALYLNESPLSLASIIKEMDAVNKAGPNAYWLGAAFLRLRKRGWLVVENENTYGLTPEARRFMDTIVKWRRYFAGPDEHLGEWMFANPPPGYEPFDEGYHERYTFPEI